MANGPPNPRDLGYYFAIGQVGLEMVLPIALGAFLDYRFGWAPWATVAGVALGLVGGVAHLVTLAGRQNQSKGRGRSQGPAG